MSSDFEAKLFEKANLVNKVLRELLDKPGLIAPNIKEPVAYTLDSPGKRIRAALVLWSCELIAGQINPNAEITAAAIEMVHTYSLVHDDLPAMDNDDLRRGRPTCHKAFDEATAILTGDALLTLAFEVLATEIDNAATAVKLIAELAKAAGPAGIIAGQLADLQAENTKGSRETVEYIHTNKTARMFQCSAVCGGICGGADSKQLESLAQYGLKIGIGFQIADDILDVSASSVQLGKTAGKDQKAAKCTYPAVIGLKSSTIEAKRLADQAISALQPFGPSADTLRELALALLKRSS